MSCLSLVTFFLLLGSCKPPSLQEGAISIRHVATQQMLSQLIDSFMLKISAQGCEFFKGIVSYDRKFGI